MTDTAKQPARKRMTTGEAVLLAQTPNDRYRDVIRFCHEVKRDYGSAANAARAAIESSEMYQDWKQAQDDKITEDRTRSPSGQFVSKVEQNCRLAQ